MNAFLPEKKKSFLRVRAFLLLTQVLLIQIIHFFCLRDNMNFLYVRKKAEWAYKDIIRIDITKERFCARMH